MLKYNKKLTNIIDVLNGEWDQNEYTRKKKSEKVVFPEARVLVVDDSKVERKYLAGLLSKLGIEADLTENCAEGVKKSCEKQYDIIRDQSLPLSGLQRKTDG